MVLLLTDLLGVAIVSVNTTKITSGTIVELLLKLFCFWIDILDFFLLFFGRYLLNFLQFAFIAIVKSNVGYSLLRDILSCGII